MLSVSYNIYTHSGRIKVKPVISFNNKTNADDQKKHADFVDRMTEKGYTQKQVRLLSEWYLRVRKSS